MNESSGVGSTERAARLPNRLVGGRDTALAQEILDIPKTQAEAIVKPNRVTDDLGWKAISAVAGRLAGHPPTLPVAAST